MIRLLQWLIFGHVCEWKTIAKGNMYESGEDRRSGDLPHGTWYHQQCTHCGTVVSRRLVP